MMLWLIAVCLPMMVALVTCWLVRPGAWYLRNILLASIAFGLATEVASGTAQLLAARNSLIYNICVPLEFLLLLALVARFRRRWRKGLLAAALLGCAAFVVSGMIQDPTAFILVEGVLVISAIMAVVLLAALWSLAAGSEVALHKVPEFWVFMGLLVYFGGMVPYIGMVRFMFRQDQELAR